MSEQPTPQPTDAATWTSPVPFHTEGALPSAEALLEGPVYALWHEPMFESTDFKEYLGWVEVCFPSVGSLDAHFSGDVYNERYWDTDENEPVKVMNVGTVVIPRELEGHKLGEKLTRALIFEAVKSGCEEMEVDFKHPASFKAFLRAVGFDRMTFSSQYGLSGLTQEQMLERIEGYGPKGFRPRRLMDVRSTEATIDLRGLDTSEWGAPEEFQVPVEADEW